MNESALINQLEGLNAHQALALANLWHGEKQFVRTHVTIEEVVFQFESGKVKKNALPEDEMMAADINKAKEAIQKQKGDPRLSEPP